MLKKGITLAITYVLMQLVLMLILYLAFDLNLFEVDKNKEVNFIANLSTIQLKVFVFFNQVFGLLLPAIIYLLIIYGKGIWKRIQLNFNIKPEKAILGLAVLIFSYPSIQFLAELNQHFPLSEWMSQTASDIEFQMEKLIKMDNNMALFTNILLIALLPSIAEELFFRGLIQKELLQLTRNGHAGIWITAIIFSAFHLQFDGFLPRLGLGLLLGYVYYFTGSLLIPILMHFVNNAIMVILVFFNTAQNPEISDSGPNMANIMLVIISMIVVVYLLKNLQKKPRKDGFKEVV